MEVDESTQTADDREQAIATSEGTEERTVEETVVSTREQEEEETEDELEDEEEEQESQTTRRRVLFANTETPQRDRPPFESAPSPVELSLREQQQIQALQIAELARLLEREDVRQGELAEIRVRLERAMQLTGVKRRAGSGDGEPQQHDRAQKTQLTGPPHDGGAQRMQQLTGSSRGVIKSCPWRRRRREKRRREGRIWNLSWFP